MKVSIECKDRYEAESIKLAMADKTIRAMVVVSGTLLKLPTDRARERCLRYVRDELDERSQLAK